MMLPGVLKLLAVNVIACPRVGKAGEVVIVRSSRTVMFRYSSMMQQKVLFVSLWKARSFEVFSTSYVHQVNRCPIATSSEKLHYASGCRKGLQKLFAR